MAVMVVDVYRGGGENSCFGKQTFPLPGVGGPFYFWFYYRTCERVMMFKRSRMNMDVEPRTTR